MDEETQIWKEADLHAETPFEQIWRGECSKGFIKFHRNFLLGMWKVLLMLFIIKFKIETHYVPMYYVPIHLLIPITYWKLWLGLFRGRSKSEWLSHLRQVGVLIKILAEIWLWCASRVNVLSISQAYISYCQFVEFDSFSSWFFFGWLVCAVVSVESRCILQSIAEVFVTCQNNDILRLNQLLHIFLI